MRITLFASFEPALLESVLRFWNERVPRFQSIEVHGPGSLRWGLRSDVASDELRAFLLDANGMRAAVEDELAPVFHGDRRGRAPLVGLLSDEPEARRLRSARAEWIDALGAASRAGVDDVFDAESRELVGVPYTDDALLAFGTAVFRAASAAVTPPPKVLALDCDGTLWQGLCAEEGPRGVGIGPEQRQLYEALAAQKRAGRLLVLVSKNVHEDVESVFRERDDLGLRWSDLAGTRIGWGNKSSALRELARELNLGLDAFVFLDDSPAECAEVRAGCHEVAVLQIPQRELGPFLDAAWPLDLLREDGHGSGGLGEARTTLYQDEALRRAALEEAPSYPDHIRSLELRTTVRRATPADEARIFELAQRTNQFHSAADRPTAEAVHEHLAQNRLAAIVVSDRFGDYGLSGAAFFERDRDALRASRLMLSCRVLGRGVEEDVFDALVTLARSEGLEALVIDCATTARNFPVRRFLAAMATALGARGDEQAGRLSWRFLLAGLDACPRLLLRDEAQETTAVPGAASPDWTRVAELTRDVATLAAAMGLSRVTGETPAASGDEGILQVVSDVLGRAVSRDDNLYALGAGSLQIVRLLARLKSRLGLALPMGDVLHRANVSDLLALGRAAGAAAPALRDTFFDQVQSLYDDDLAPAQ